MNRRAACHRLLFRAGSATAWTAALLLVGLTGCTTVPEVMRPQQAEETERDRYGVSTIGEYCEVADVGPKYVGGIGIVTCLDGTGGDSPRDQNRSDLEKYLRNHNGSIGEVLASGCAALVIVSGEIPPGTREGDPFDVEVSLPPGSKATSLRGGVLELCPLATFDYQRGPQGVANTLKGQTLGSAAGPLQLSLGSSEGDQDDERLKKGHIWQGGRSRIDNTLSLVMNSDQKFSRRTMQLADRINQTFGVGSAVDVKLATAIDERGLTLRVPPAYKLNIPHYLRVVRLIPMMEVNEHVSDEPGQPKTYRQRLAEDLLDPRRTVTAALRLEALGPKSKPILESGLKSEHPLVRFCSAESLTYLGNGIGALALAELVEQQPFLRSYALSAMASLDESVPRGKLLELMEKGVAQETRYGAFRALQALDPRDSATSGELLNKSFRLHRVAPQTQPLLHLCTLNRCEIVLFGSDIKLVPPFALASNGYTVTAQHATDDHCVVGFVTRRGKQIRVPCSFNVNDVLHLLAKMDATYPEVVEMLIDAGNSKNLNCPMALNALPLVPTVEALAASGKDGDGLLGLSGQDLGATPTLYERPAPKPVRNHGAATSHEPLDDSMYMSSNDGDAQPRRRDEPPAVPGRGD